MFDFASRIAKLDALNLDNEFISFLKREIFGVLSSLTSEEFLLKFRPEVTFLVKFVIWKFTTSSSGSTVGQKILGIKYAHAPGKYKLLLLLEVVIPYLIERLRSISNATPVVQKTLTALNRAESVCKFLSVINFCLFLVQNRYPTLTTRVLALPIVSINRPLGPSAVFTYQIRELLWHQFADFLMTLLPLVSFHKIRRSFNSFLGKIITPGKPTLDNAMGSSEEIKNGQSTRDQGNIVKPGEAIACSLCKEDAVIPQKIGKEHFCYFCYHQTVSEGF